MELLVIEDSQVEFALWVGHECVQKQGLLRGREFKIGADRIFTNLRKGLGHGIK